MPSVIRECVLLQDYGVLSDLNAAGVCLGGANDSIDIADPQNISQPLSWKPEVPGVISGYVLLAIDIDQPTRKAVKSLTLRTETMQFSHFIIFAFAAAMAAEDPVVRYFASRKEGDGSVSNIFDSRRVQFMTKVILKDNPFK